MSKQLKSLNLKKAFCRINTKLWKKGYGIVTLLAIPPFPYVSSDKYHNVLVGTPIYYDKMSENDLKHVHLEEVSYHKKSKQYYISDSRGYVLYVTSVSPSVEQTQKNVQKIIDKIIFPKKMYRQDIGDSFKNKHKSLLEKWGYL